MPDGGRIVAGQGTPASTALHRTVIGHAPTRFDRIECPLMSCVTGLSATLPTARLALLPGRHTRSIMRWWLRTVMRRAPRLFPKLLMRGTQAADFLFQRGHTLQQAQNHLLDTGGRALPVFRRDLRLGRSQQCRFHEPETTRSGLVFTEFFLSRERVRIFIVNRVIQWSNLYAEQRCTISQSGLV